MQLRTSRLCLDCEEIHESQQCPLCASETFVYLTRWVPVPERRQRPRGAAGPPPSPETLDTYREMLGSGGKTWGLLKRGALGLALVGMAGWIWRSNSRGDGAASSGADRDRRVE